MTGRRRGANKGFIGGREQGARVAPKEGSVEGKSAINVRDLVKMFRLGGETITAVDGASFEVQSGETVSIVGPSGSGKSTLLGLLGGLDSPTAGRIAIDGVEIGGMNEGDLTRIRNEKLGFVFQFFNLIPTLTAVENVALPIQFARKRKFNPEERARELLGQLGLGERMEHLPQQLSGGEQQRVAIARALANGPPILLADEPTGNLNSEASELVLDNIKQAHQEYGTTVIIVTHNLDVARQMQRTLTLVDGRIV
jgi:putative ABC transport system ATP-binding protein